jgi:MFS transporter, DHA1 family, multidrug resistance protein
LQSRGTVRVPDIGREASRPCNRNQRLADFWRVAGSRETETRTAVELRSWGVRPDAPTVETIFAMELWKKNLYSLWIAQFTAGVGLSMIMPFLPFYLKELGVTDPDSVKVWSGLVFSAPFMVSALMQPLWGVLGDRYGRKPMVVRAMMALGAANLIMGFAQTAHQLLILRFCQGFLSGFVAPSLALLSSCTPDERSGQAIGTLQSSLVTGMIVGPLLGGVLAHFFGYRPLFFGTGCLCLAGSFVVVVFVEENFTRPGGRKKTGLRQNLGFVFSNPGLRFLFLLLVVVQFSIQVVGPFLSLYVEFLKFPEDYVAMMSGAVFGITGVTNASTAPMWGQRGDRIGYRRVLRYALGGAALFYLPQAFVTSAYQLLALRAGLGIFIGGIVPTILTIVQKSTPDRSRGGIYGIFQSGLLLGTMAGPLVGGLLSASLGLRAIFVLTTGLILAVALWERKANPDLLKPS